MENIVKYIYCMDGISELLMNIGNNGVLDIRNGVLYLSTMEYYHIMLGGFRGYKYLLDKTIYCYTGCKEIVLYNSRTIKHYLYDGEMYRIYYVDYIEKNR